MVGTNDIPSKMKVGELLSFYENLVNHIRSHSNTNLIIAALIPRPCDLSFDPNESRVKYLIRSLKICVSDVISHFYIRTELFYITIRLSDLIMLFVTVVFT